jgi:hypothetical protein
MVLLRCTPGNRKAKVLCRHPRPVPEASGTGHARNSGVCESIDILVRRRPKQASVHSLLFPAFGRLIYAQANAACAQIGRTR